MGNRILGTLRSIWTVASLILWFVGWLSIFHDLVHLVDIVSWIVALYRSIVYPVYAFVFAYLPFHLPNWFKDAMTIALASVSLSFRYSVRAYVRFRKLVADYRILLREQEEHTANAQRWVNDPGSYSDSIGQSKAQSQSARDHYRKAVNELDRAKNEANGAQRAFRRRWRLAVIQLFLASVSVGGALFLIDSHAAQLKPALRALDQKIDSYLG